MYFKKISSIILIHIKVNNSAVTLPFSDSSLNIQNNAGTLTVDNGQFYLTFGNAFLKLVSCGSTIFGLCAGTEADPTASISKYLPSDQVYINGDCAPAIVADSAFFFTQTSDSALPAVLEGHKDKVESLLALKSGLLASGSNDDTIKIWNLDTGSIKRELKGHTGDVRCLAELKNGNLVSGSDDNSIKIWNTDSGSEIRTLKGHTDFVRCLAVLQNGNLASGSFDTLQLKYGIANRVL